MIECGLILQWMEESDYIIPVIKWVCFIFISLTSIFFYFYICTVRLDITKVYYSPTNARVFVLKKY